MKQTTLFSYAGKTFRLSLRRKNFRAYRFTLLLLMAFPCLVFAQKNIPALSNVTHPPSSITDKFSRYQHYTMEQGLSSNWVTDIAQDDDGFLWFGTNEGLNRFDGEHFTPLFYQANQQEIGRAHV